MLGLACHDGRVEGDGHGHGIRQGNAVLAGLFEVGFLGSAIAFDGEARQRGVQADHAFDIA